MGGIMAPLALLACMGAFCAAIFIGGVNNIDRQEKELRADTAALNHMGFEDSTRVARYTYRVALDSCKVELTKLEDGSWSYKGLIIKDQADLKAKANKLGLGYCF